MNSKIHTPTPEKPKITFMLGWIRVSIWENEDQQGNIRHSYTVQKSYKDSQGKYYQTTSFSKSDLVVIRHLIKQAIEFEESKEWVESQPNPPSEASQNTDDIPY